MAKIASKTVDIFSTGLLISHRANVKTGSALCLAELELQELLLRIGKFIGQVSKISVVL